MISEDQLRTIIEQVMQEMNVNDRKEPIGNNISKYCPEEDCNDKDILDITSVNLRKEINIEKPFNRETYLKLKESTDARLGISRAGARYKTFNQLRFRADHAVAMDAVFTYVSEDFIEDMGIFTVNTMCKDKDEYLTRPDLGRKFNEEEVKLIKEKCVMNPQVQIYISDGLSSTAIETNAKDAYRSIEQGLNGHGIKVGTPFFVKHGRVPAMDSLSEIINPDVIIVLIGERPGLATGESMSCYMAYKPTVGMPESKRTVVSNIHKNGTAAVEAGAYIAEIVKKMLDQKASGLDLKL